jgi:hypothetical protein
MRNQEDDMLEGVTNIDWEALDFPQMPQLLYQLTSQEEAVREAAYDQLYDKGMPELHKAAPYVIPFLIELLTIESVEQKNIILLLLMQMASEATGAFEQVPPTRPFTLSVLHQLSLGISVYLKFADQPETADHTILLLGYFPDHLREIAPTLRTLIEENTSPSLTVLAINAVAQLLIRSNTLSPQERSDYQSLFERHLAATDPATRVVAAYALIQWLKSMSPLNIERQLIDEVVQPDSDAHRFQWSMAEILTNLGVDRGVYALLYFMPMVGEITQLYDIIHALLDLAFNGGKITRHGKSYRYASTKRKPIIGIYFSKNHTTTDQHEVVHMVSDLQRLVLRHLFETKLIWRIHSNIWDLYGLPDSAAGMRRLVES